MIVSSGVVTVSVSIAFSVGAGFFSVVVFVFDAVWVRDTRCVVFVVLLPLERDTTAASTVPDNNAVNMTNIPQKVIFWGGMIEKMLLFFVIFSLSWFTSQWCRMRFYRICIGPWPLIFLLRFRGRICFPCCVRIHPGHICRGCCCRHNRI